MGSTLQLNPQYLHIVCTICASIPLLKVYLAVKHAFPNAFTASQFITTTLVVSATNLGFNRLVMHMCQMTDTDFLCIMVILVSKHLHI